MAGIGISLRRLTRQDSLWGFLRAQCYSGILSSGAWIISISVLVLIYFLSKEKMGSYLYAIPFLVCATYCASFALIVSGPLQQILIRFIADTIFEKKDQLLLGSLLSLTLVMSLIAGIVGFIACYFMLSDVHLLLVSLLFFSFMSLVLIWLLSNALSGLKDYLSIVFYFFLGYGVIFLMVYWIEWTSLTGYIFSYFVGQGILLIGFYRHFMVTFPSNQLKNHAFWHYLPSKWVLVWNGLFFQLGVWADKYIFWQTDVVNMPIIGKLAASPVYDMPMFLSYLFVIPGLTLFFYEVEANFSHMYQKLYHAIRNGSELSMIYQKHNRQVLSARMGMLGMLILQGMICLLGIVFAKEILAFVGLSPLHKTIFQIDLVSAFLTVFLIGLVNLLYYLDRNHDVCLVVTILFVLNASLSYVSIYLNPIYYGLGFTVALLVSDLVAFILLNKAFKRQVMVAFMSH